jgi:hypothetical protein
MCKSNMVLQIDRFASPLVKRLPASRGQARRDITHSADAGEARGKRCGFSRLDSKPREAGKRHGGCEMPAGLIASMTDPPDAAKLFIEPEARSQWTSPFSKAAESSKMESSKMECCETASGEGTVREKQTCQSKDRVEWNVTKILQNDRHYRLFVWSITSCIDFALSPSSK